MPTIITIISSSICLLTLKQQTVMSNNNTNFLYIPHSPQPPTQRTALNQAPALRRKNMGNFTLLFRVFFHALIPTCVSRAKFVQSLRQSASKQLEQKHTFCTKFEHQHGFLRPPPPFSMLRYKRVLNYFEPTLYGGAGVCSKYF